MRKKWLLVFSVCLLISSLLTACNGTETTPTPTTATTPTPSQTSSTGPANWWDKFGEPQYGGTINVWSTSLDGVSFAPANRVGGKYQNAYLEPLFMEDLTVDPGIHNYQGEFVTPDYYRGLLAEDWEQTDPLTMTVHLRQGVYWHDIAPVNGREFTADDVQYFYDGMLGTGSGFTEPNPFYIGLLSLVEKATATDKYTVEFKLREPGYFSALQILTFPAGMAAPEVVEQYGADSSDVGHILGTGPWIYSDFIAGSSFSLTRNPDYWGTDERHPENQLPYADSLDIIAVPELSTAVAAMRTGKLDIMASLWGGLSVTQAINLQDTNPDIQIAWLPSKGPTIEFRTDMEPFTDIRVRKALQLAVDREVIAETLYQGTSDPTPCGLINVVEQGWCTPYDEWPAELQAEYTYNPEKAKELLAEAGYPDGFDTNCVVASSDNIELLQVIKAYFMEIGVDMEITSMDRAGFMAYVQSGKHDQMNMWDHCGITGNPLVNGLVVRSSAEITNVVQNNDTAYEDMLSNLAKASNEAEAKSISVEMDMYAIEKHWAVNVFSVLKPIGYQPWLKGYNGELLLGVSPYVARWWIDQEVKASMGF